MFELFTSGTLWPAVSALAAVALVALGVVTHRRQFPRRRLLYGLKSATGLLASHAGVSDLEVRHRDRILSNPYVAEVILAGQGRRDIPSSLFDQGTPIRMSLGAPIVELLDVSSLTAPDSYKLQEDDGVVLIGPCLLGRRQRVTFSLLLDGKPELTCYHNLIDVDVRKIDDLIRPTRAEWLALGVVTVSLLITVTSLVIGELAFALLGIVVMAFVLGMFPPWKRS